ncbi:MULTISPECIES: DUF3352 domain-containing protein [unclassified Tenacibaculum]|uniref:DUF3352 domain-containing protein n=1 Tax=unclassified Tenacibaculum TaxID=2635139 RepID=UPI001F27FCB6|nr:MULTISPECIES: DUF3352 domain-containing protein [unclassified Tenacibaculum]MCF2874025.1 DUF3352 domain-containing protein [Tenacibaculum sp. Cn5-1]MCF2934606.1 DUF3352 domain-containing protein [Tenacibaculum sp. Cn5-34]MCG7510816.1 DUF3352 domain-containing protein [Tenacibaculum sp. Cn5-46]
MKKKIIWAILIALFSFIGYQAYIFTLADEDNINPIYLIPKNAAIVLETERPIDTWDEISSSEIWKHFQTNSYFKEVTKDISGFNKLFKDQKDVIDFIGERDLLISIHSYKPKKYGLLYVIDLQKLAKLRFLKSAIQKLADSNFKVTQRTYKEHEIIELYNKSNRETLYLSFIKNQLIASYTHVLVEQSINQYLEPVIGRDLNFVEIKKETGNDGFFNVYIQYKYFDQYLACFTNSSNLKNFKNVQNALFYSGFDISIMEGVTLQALGYTNVNKTSQTFLKALQNSGKGKRSIAKIAPRNTSLYLSFSFDSFDAFHTNLEALEKDNAATFKTYTNQIKSIEDQLEIDIQKHIYSWIGNEVGLLHFNSDLSKNKKDIAAVIKADDIDHAKENLDFILSKIKENTPLKFKQINYKGYPIHFFDLKGFFKMLAGKTFAKMEKPYFTIIDDFVVFSTSPNTLKEIINNHLVEYTLAESERFEEFNYHFENKSSVFAYAETANSYNDLLSLLDYKTQQQLKKNKKYFNSFSQVGIQLISKGDLFESNITLSYQSEEELSNHQNKETALKEELYKKLVPEKDSVIVETAETIFNIQAIHPSDLSAKEYKEYYDDKQLKFEVELDDGVLDGNFKLYYSSGNLKLKGQFKNGKKAGTWRAYSDKERKQIFKKRF